MQIFKPWSNGKFDSTNILLYQFDQGATSIRPQYIFERRLSDRNEHRHKALDGKIIVCGK